MNIFIKESIFTIIKTVLLFQFIFSYINCYAHHNIETHNNDLSRILFGNSGYLQCASTKGKTNFILICEAVNIVTDFTSDNENRTNGQRYLNDLKKHGIPNVPNISEISFTANQYHQVYTHYGWEKGYRVKDCGNWEKRKLLLLSTVEYLGNFAPTEKIKIDAFAGLLYDIHILGDHIGDGEKTRYTRIRLMSEPDYKGQLVNPTSDGPFNNPTLFTYFIYHIERLFREQRNTTEYQQLITYFKYYHDKFIHYAGEVPYKEINKFAEQTRDILICYLPVLLKRENFFKNIFFH